MLIGDLFVAFRGDSKQLEIDAVRAGDKVGKTLGDRIKSKLSAANIGTVIGAGIGSLGIAALKMTQQYDDAVDAIRVGTGATGEALDDLTDSFKTVARRVPADLGTVGQVIADLNTRTGQTGEGLESLAEQILLLSRITRTDAATNVANLTRLFGDWSVASEDQAEALDKVFRASQATGIGIDELATQMVGFGAPLRSLGMDFDEGAAMLAKWEKEGVNTTLALSGLKQALGKFAIEGVNVKEGLADLVEEILNAEDATAAMAIGAVAFGKKAGPDMTAAILEGRFAYEDLVDVIENGSDTIAQANDDTSGLSESWLKFKNTVATTVGPILTGFGDIATEMGNLIFLLPALTAGIGRGLGALWTKAGAGPAVRAAATAAGAAAGGLYSAAMVVGAKLSSAITGALVALGLPGSAIMTKAGILGQVVGTRITLGVVAGLALLPVITAAINTAIVGTLPGQAMDAVSAQSLDLLAKARKLRTETAAEQAALAQELYARYDEEGRAVEALRARYDALNRTSWVLHSGTKEQIEYLVNNGIEAYLVWADSLAAVDDTAGALEGDLASLEDELGDTGDEMSDMTPEVITLSSRLGDLRQSIKAADEAWESLLKSPDENTKSLKTLNREIKEWETRYLNALKRGDVAQSEFALSQLQAAEADRKARRQASKAAEQQKADIKTVAKTLDISMREAASLYRKHNGDLEDTLAAGQALDDLDPTVTVKAETTKAEAALDRIRARLAAIIGDSNVNVTVSAAQGGGTGRITKRAGGGPVTAHRPYWVGENRRPELFVPDTPGMIIPERDVAMGSGKLDVYVHDQDGGLARAGMSVSELADGIAGILRGDRGGTRYSWGGG